MTCFWDRWAGTERGRGKAWSPALFQDQPGHHQREGHPPTHCQHICHPQQGVAEEDIANHHSTQKSTDLSLVLVSGVGEVEANGRKVTECIRPHLSEDIKVFSHKDVITFLTDFHRLCSFIDSRNLPHADRHCSYGCRWCKGSERGSRRRRSA